jgi:hypothetical protein
MARLLVALGTAGMLAIASAMPAAAAPLTATPAASAESMVTTVAMKKKMAKKKMVKKVSKKKKVVKVAVAPAPICILDALFHRKYAVRALWPASATTPRHNKKPLPAQRLERFFCMARPCRTWLPRPYRYWITAAPSASTNIGAVFDFKALRLTSKP